MTLCVKKNQERLGNVIMFCWNQCLYVDSC